MCNFCNKKKNKDWDAYNKGKIFKNDSIASVCDIYIEGSKLILYYDAYSCDSSFSEKINIKFCPMCGSKLS